MSRARSRDGWYVLDVIRLVSWNLAGRDLWRDLHGLDADIALLQEARLPSSEWSLEHSAG